MKQVTLNIFKVFTIALLTCQPGGATAQVNNVSEAARLMVSGLSDKLKLDNINVTLGKLTLINSQVSSEFAGNFKIYLESELKRLPEINSVKKTTGLRTRGFSFSPDETGKDDTENNAITNINDTSNRMNAIDATLSDYYRVFEKSVFVTAYLINNKGEKLTEQEVEISKDVIPWAVMPGNMVQVEQTESQLKQVDKKIPPQRKFRIQLQIDKGNGAVYKNGEEMLVFFRTERSCFLKVLYIDVAGNRIIMYPTARDNENQMMKPNREYELHASNRYAIEPPFGSERILAFCSEQKPANIKEITLGRGYKGYDPATSTAEIVGNLRSLGVTGKGLIAETQVFLTTVP